MTATSVAHWAQVKSLFETVVELPVARRETAIAQAGLDADSLTELRSSLAHHDQATGGHHFMALSAASPMSGEAAQQASPSAARIGQRLGAWGIVRSVGAGGMGEVFEACRADGSYEGRAAVKLLKRGMDSSAVLRRFAQERQALARLSHPHIARLLDDGASAEGLLYFVLEFVDGQPIDVAVRGLNLEARLNLFLQLADAVAHAHRNLLVHRDLKPGNVLVDTEGQVKLLDFGIAKALDPLEGNERNTTVGGQRPYTPNHASPEQVRDEPVSTATDINSLGVLLYQMLTGTRPTGRNATSPDRQRAAWLASVLGSVGLVLGLAASLVQDRWLGAVGVAGLAAGLALALLQARRAALARDSAQRHAAELRRVCGEVVVEYEDAITHVPGDQRRQAELLATSAGYLERLLSASDEEPALRQDLVAELGAMHARLAHLRSSGEFNAREDAALVVQHAGRARVLLAEAEHGGALPPAAWEWWALALGDLARQAQTGQQLDNALAHLDESDPVLQRGLRRHPGHATLQRLRGEMVMLAVQVHDGWDRPDLAQPEQALALLLARLKQFAAAAEAAREAVRWREQQRWLKHKQAALKRCRCWDGMRTSC
jgi:hypothetical protein